MLRGVEKQTVLSVDLKIIRIYKEQKSNKLFHYSVKIFVAALTFISNDIVVGFFLLTH